MLASISLAGFIGGQSMGAKRNLNRSIVGVKYTRRENRFFPYHATFFTLPPSIIHGLCMALEVLLLYMQVVVFTLAKYASLKLLNLQLHRLSMDRRDGYHASYSHSDFVYRQPPCELIFNLRPGSVDPHPPPSRCRTTRPPACSLSCASPDSLPHRQRRRRTFISLRCASS